MIKLVLRVQKLTFFKTASQGKAFSVWHKNKSPTFNKKCEILDFYYEFDSRNQFSIEFDVEFLSEQ